MTTALATTVLALWGTLLSTVLAAIKIAETIQARRRLVISYSFSNDPEQANEIVLINPTGTPVLLGYWELHLLEGEAPWSYKRYRSTYPDVGYTPITVPAHDRYTLNLAGSDHFDIPYRKGWGRRVILLLHVEGASKPLRLVVWRSATPLGGRVLRLFGKKTW